MHVSHNKFLRTEKLHTTEKTGFLYFILLSCISIAFYQLSSHLIDFKVYIHLPPLLFIIFSKHQKTPALIASACAIGFITEISLSLFIGSVIANYLVSYLAVFKLRQLFSESSRYYTSFFAFIFLALWHLIFWIIK